LSAADVDDLAQEVFLRLLRYGGNIALENPGAYLFRVTENVANEWSERARIRYPHDDSALEELRCESSQEPEVAVVEAQRIQHIQSILAQLPARRREVVMSHLEHGMTYKEIAQQRGLTNRVVRRDIARAYGVLRLHLKIEDL
jgi:RNA polymerase sigma-70 factor (ECF subfamily)